MKPYEIITHNTTTDCYNHEKIPSVVFQLSTDVSYCNSLTATYTSVAMHVNLPLD